MISLERPKAEMQSEDTPNMVCQEKITGVFKGCMWKTGRIFSELW